MGTTYVKLKEFPGFAAEYDMKEKPYFLGQLLEDMRKIASNPLGQQLLKQIADAKPKVRTPGGVFSKVKFTSHINVTCIPATGNNAREFTQVGKRELFGKMYDSTAPAHNNTFCHFKGGSVAAAGDDAAKSDGRGCVSVMSFTNAQVITSNGEPAPSFIVLAHELIHSLHHVTGTTHLSEEEQKTSGLGAWSGEPMSENGFRAAFGIKRRMIY